VAIPSSAPVTTPASSGTLAAPTPTETIDSPRAMMITALWRSAK
jgi:hypothetical protein